MINWGSDGHLLLGFPSGNGRTGHTAIVLHHRGWNTTGVCFKCKQTLYFVTRGIWEKSRDCGKEQCSLEDMPWKTDLQIFFTVSQQRYEKKKVQVDLLEGLLY